MPIRILTKALIGDLENTNKTTIWEQHRNEIRSEPTLSTKREDRHERVDRIARQIIDEERLAREKKTARLRALRLQREQESSS